METNQEKDLLSKDIDELISIFDNGENKTKYSDIEYDRDKDYYLFYLQRKKKIENYIIFKEKIKVEISKSNNEENPLYFEIRSNLQLLNYLEEFNMDINHLIILNEAKNKLSDCINTIQNYVENNSIKLKLKEVNIPKIEFGKDCLLYNEDYTPNAYSKYFYQYFPSEKEEPDKIFYFYKSNEREQIKKNIFELKTKKKIKKYKLTGPYAIGKSLTLFKISKSFINIIYINLKIMKMYENNCYAFLEILFSESSRVKMSEKNEKEFNKKIKTLILQENIFEIFIKILKLILNLIEGRTLILILDQYKPKNYNNYLLFQEKIDELCKKNLKVVYCSSINDNIMRDFLMPTFIKFRNNLKFLNDENQDYYFYYSDLFKQIKSDDISYILFNNRTKYIKIIDKENLQESLKKVDEIILNKLKDFKQYQNSKEIIINNYSLPDILLFLKNAIYQEISLNNILEILSVCPFKFFVIEFKTDTFMIKPIFPYIEYFISEYINNKDCEEYFNKEKYNNIYFLSNKVKGEYFEFAAKMELKKRLESFYVINKVVYVDQIAEMNEITTPFEYFISSLKNKDGEILDEEEIKENDKNNNSEKIIINLDKDINEVELKNRILKNFEYDLKNFNIYTKNEIIKDKEKITENYEAFGMKKDIVEQLLFKEIDDYRKENFEQKVQKRFEEILQIISKKRIENKKKREIIIPIRKVKKLKHRIINEEVYSGNENILIDQTNSNGKIVDYAFLFGERENKKFVTFQMKCYSNNTNLEDIFENKYIIKNQLSKMLINSIKLFNCKITEWHYILVFYYNDKDKLSSIGIKTILSCINKNVEFILFNPINNMFYLKNKDNIIEENKKKFNLISIESNLDQISFMNMINVLNFEKYNYVNKTNNELKIEYWQGLAKFLEDFKKLDMNVSDLNTIFGVKNIIYYCHFKFDNEIISPRKNYIILYKKKNSLYFLGIKNSLDIIQCYDLESKKILEKYYDLIDSDFGYSYVLYFEEKLTHKRTFNEMSNNEYLVIRRTQIPKLI